MNNELQELNKILAQDNWIEELENRSITINWSKDENYLILKYNQLASDFNDPAVRACRGTIYSVINGKPFQCVCLPFLKFGNYGENYCPEIDWATARVLEKIDGSLMKLWYHHESWHLSTNGTIDAYGAEVEEHLSFGELFELALMDCLGTSFNDFTNKLDKDYVYMFELTSPENRVVIEYPERNIWFLSRRNMTTLEEDQHNDTGLEVPKTFYLNNLNDCLNLATRMSKDQEGMVVNDAHFNRIKIKSPEYLIAAHLVNNRKITTKRIIRMMQDLSIDDFLAYCNEYAGKVNTIQEAFLSIAEVYNNAWNKVKDFSIGAELDSEKRRVFAHKISSYGEEQGFLFWKCSHRELNAEVYLLNLRLRTLKRLIDKELDKKS